MQLVYVHHKAEHYGVPQSAATRTNPVNPYGSGNRREVQAAQRRAAKALSKLKRSKSK